MRVLNAEEMAQVAGGWWWCKPAPCPPAPKCDPAPKCRSKCKPKCDDGDPPVDP